MVFDPPSQSVDGVGKCAVRELSEAGGIARRRCGILGIHCLRPCHGHSVNDVVEELLLPDHWLWGLVALFENESGHDSERLRGTIRMYWTGADGGEMCKQKKMKGRRSRKQE